MPVLSYHPALDPYHTAFRSLRVFNLARNPIEYDRLRLLDLYLLFPEFAGDIRLPPSARAWRNKLLHGGNKYWSTCDKMLLLQQMTPIHKCALSLLESTGLVVEDPVSRLWSVLTDQHAIVTSAVERNQREEEIVGFLSEVLLPLELTGPQGLKARTGLMEWRYDEA